MRFSFGLYALPNKSSFWSCKVLDAFVLDVALKFSCNGLLQELEIDFAQYEHPVVLTVEAAVSLVVCCFNFDLLGFVYSGV